MEYGGIVDLSAALRKWYGLSYSGEPDSIVYNWLERNRFRCVVVMLLDAMGVSVLEKTLREDGFFRSHMSHQVSTVFPPTTTAATTAFLTGKYPCETGWLGWQQYFKEVDDNVVLFRGMGYYTNENYGSLGWDALPVKPIHEELKEKGIVAASVWPLWGDENPCGDFSSFCWMTRSLAENGDMRFVYAYWDNPDYLMHKVSPDAPCVKELLRNMEKEVANMKLPEDCGLLVIADHSQVSAKTCDLAQYPEITQCFLRKPALETRSPTFFIKPGMEKEFEDRFRSVFEGEFDLYDKQQVMSMHLYGKGTQHARFEEMIGEYVAVARGYLQLTYGKKVTVKGNHAGGLEEEALIPVIISPK